ncbi:MAG: ribulose-phosphate 3-epimerase [Synergistaceae bacterium]|nr:ribulose-phosphate 3-epimerase [Synergistaceae bacterium]MBR0167794.1 ribulose-phosphate 3-epimerase [Synergistaceae bacterium]MBR0278922.1 ribulose-phosphate 3-epimerase [Synergistaceae bacterium]
MERQEELMREILFAPSLLGADPLNISGSIDSLGNNFDWLHLDIMDGHFVRNLSFGPAFSQALRKKYPDSFIDAHLMTNNLETVLPLFIESGASSITVHAETEPHLLHAVISTIRNAGIKAGIALCPPTSVRQIESILDIADLVLVMSVTPGFGGQKFIESSLEKVRELASIREVHKYNYKIEIDGGINENNIVRVVLAGCDVIVMGSAVFREVNPASWLADLRVKIKEALKVDRT